MAFPFVSEENFEDGTLGHFDAEVDTQPKLTFPHYTELARFQGLAAPYRGAYCMQIDLGVGTTQAYVQETGDWDLTAGTGELYLGFALWVDPSIVMATTNEFALLQFWSATSTVEGGVYFNFTTANGYRVGIGIDAGAASSFVPGFTLGEWHWVECFFDPAGGAGGTIDLWVDDVKATQVTGGTAADITSGVLGAIGIDAGTTAGKLLFDRVIADDAQVYRQNRRFDQTIELTKSGHAFVGPGQIDNVTLLSGDTGGSPDNVLKVWDTDRADTNGGVLKIELKNTADDETVDPAGVPVWVSRGAYIELTGTNPRALVKLCSAVGYGSDGAVRSHGMRRA